MLGVSIRTYFLIVLMISCTLFFFSKNFFQKRFFGYPEQIVMSIDFACSSSIQAKMYQKAYESFYLSARTIARNLTEISPIIASASVHRKVDGTLYIDVQAENPALTINNELVLSQAQRIIPKEDFETGSLIDLPTIIIGPRVAITQETAFILAMIDHIKPYLNQQYQLKMMHAHTIDLIDATGAFSIRFAQDEMPSVARLQQVHEVIKDFSIRHAKQIKDHHVIADLRFKNQLVVYRELKEVRS